MRVLGEQGPHPQRIAHARNREDGQAPAKNDRSPGGRHAAQPPNQQRPPPQPRQGQAHYRARRELAQELELGDQEQLGHGPYVGAVHRPEGEGYGDRRTEQPPETSLPFSAQDKEEEKEEQRGQGQNDVDACGECSRQGSHPQGQVRCTARLPAGHQQIDKG